MSTTKVTVLKVRDIPPPLEKQKRVEKVKPSSMGRPPATHSNPSRDEMIDRILRLPDPIRKCKKERG